jgi:hypothetical protein
MNATLYGNEIFPYRIKLKILKWGDFPGLLEWVLKATTCPA